MSLKSGSGTRDQIANIRWILEKSKRISEKTSASLTMLKPLTVWITTVENPEGGIPDHLNCLLRNLYAG